MAKRKDFSEDVKLKIAQRAAFRCCFPDCDKTLVGPSYDSDGVTVLGECAHIYAASEKGPRGQHNLTDEELTSVNNGIYLCPEHHKVIDDKKNIKLYTPSRLLLYKELHEQKISAEIGQIHYPLTWIKSIRVIKSPVLKEGIQYDFSKTTVLTGGNSNGKSVLIEYIYSALSGICVERHSKGIIELEIELSNTLKSVVNCRINDGVISYSIEDKALPFCPFDVDIMYLRNSKDKSYDGKDDVRYIAQNTNKSREEFVRLISTSDLSDGYIIDKARIENSKRNNISKIIVHNKLDDRESFFRSFSDQEQTCPIFDLTIGYSKSVSTYRNALYLLDWNEFYILDDEIKENYLTLLQKSSLHFQTIIASHTLFKNVHWTNWSSIVMTKDNNIKRELQ